MPDASPIKWHLAHTSWFFETFVLGRFFPDIGCSTRVSAISSTPTTRRWGRVIPARARPADPTVGRAVGAYRGHVDAAMARCRAADAAAHRGGPVLELGLHHEQQHQELILMDIKHLFSVNPLQPAYRAPRTGGAAPAAPLDWVDFNGGLAEIGQAGDGFRLRQRDAAPQDLPRAVPAGDTPGHQRRMCWSSWPTAAIGGRNSGCPTAGRRCRPRAGTRRSIGRGRRRGWTSSPCRRRPSIPAEPVCHVSYYEADAYAGWAGKRLPTRSRMGNPPRGRSGGRQLADGRAVIIRLPMRAGSLKIRHCAR